MKAKTMTKVTYSCLVAALLATSSLVHPSQGALAMAPTGQSIATHSQANSGEFSWQNASALYREAIIRDGSATSLIAGLAQDLGNTNSSPQSRVQAGLTLALVHWVAGSLADAEAAAKAAVDLGADPQALVLLAKIYDARGNLESATAAYEKALSFGPDTGTEKEIRFQLALIRAMDRDMKPLFDLASTEPKARRNKIALTVALMGYPGQALDLFVPPTEGEKTAARDYLRMAGWALQARRASDAKQYAWRASDTSLVDYERRYALSLLVEAHRSDDSLDALVEAFAAKPALSPEARQVWMELLNELGRIDEALALFKEGEDASFTPDERVKLIRMYQDSGRDADIIREFETLIEAEPDQVAWYSGLSEFYQIKGQDTAASGVWEAFLDKEHDPNVLLLASEAMSKSRFDDLAVRAMRGFIDQSGDRTTGLMTLFEHYLERAQIEECKAVLEELASSKNLTSSEKIMLAESFERIHEQRAALAIWEAMQAEGVAFSVDEKMYLAWLYRSLDMDEKALVIWKELWLGDISPAIKDIVEQHLISQAAELGVLGDIAYDLEQKLAAGQASQTESSFLTRIYTRVGDQVSAIEIIDEFFKSAGLDQIESLRAQAKVYLLMGDFINHGKISRKLIDADPANKAEHLRNLILGEVERLTAGGSTDEKVAELKALLNQLKEVDGEASGYQFEGGTYVLAQLHDDAAHAFRQALARSPKNGDLYLQLGNLLDEMNREEEVYAIFQALTLSAENDELFVVGIDGILNLFGPSNASKALTTRSGQVMGWLQRAIYSRLAGQDDKFYYYRLLSDIVSESGDTVSQLRVLENGLVVAEQRRLSILREMLGMTAGSDGPASFYGVDLKDTDAQLKLGRRLVGLNEALPPQVYMQLAESFLEKKDPFSAGKAFDAAVDGSGQIKLRSSAGEMFEKAGYNRHAINQFRQAYANDKSDFSLQVNLARLREKVGQDAGANEMFGAALGLLFSRQAEMQTAGAAQVVEENRYFTKVKDTDRTQTRDFKEYYFSLQQGFMTTWQHDEAVMQARLDGFEDQFRIDLDRIADKVTETTLIARFPRVLHLGRFLRGVSLATGDYARADRVDTQLVRSFTHDKDLMVSILESRIKRGLSASAERLLEAMREAAPDQANQMADLIDTAAESFDFLLQQAEKTRHFDAVLNKAVTSGDKTKMREAIRAWAKAGYYLESFHWSATLLDQSSHVAISKYISELVRKDELFLGRVFLNDQTFLSDLEAVTGTPVLTAAQLLAIVQDDPAGYIMRSATPMLFKTLPPEELKAFFFDRVENTPNRNALQVLGLFWFDLVGNPLDPAVGQEILALATDIFNKTALTGGEMNMGNMVMVTGEAVSHFEMSLTAGEVAKENWPWVRKISLAWMERMGTDFDSLLPMDLLFKGQTEEALDAVIDTIIRLRRISADNEGRIQGHLRYYIDNIVAKYSDQMKQRFRAREKRDGASPELTELYFDFFIRDLLPNDPVRLAFLKDAVSKYPTSAKYAALMRQNLEMYGQPWQAASRLARLHESDPKNLFYEGVLFLALIKAERFADAAALNEKSAQDMTAPGYFENLLNMALKQGLEPLPPADAMQLGAKFPTGIAFMSAQDDSRREQEAIVSSLVAAAKANDQGLLRENLRALWQTVMKEKRPSWKPEGQFDLEKRQKYQDILDLEWPRSGTEKDPNAGRKLFEVLATFDFSAAEFESFIRAKRVEGSADMNDLYGYLALAYKNAGRLDAQYGAVSKALVASDQEASIDDFILWTALAEQMDNRDRDVDAKIYERFLAQYHRLPVYVLIRMAPTFASKGDAETTAALYRQAIDMGVSMKFPDLQERGNIEELYSHTGKPSAKALLREICKNTDGALKEELLDYLIARVNSFVGTDTRLRQMADLFILAVVREKADIGAALKADVVSTDQNHHINAFALSGVYARAGKFEEAGRAFRRALRQATAFKWLTVQEIASMENSSNSRKGKLGQIYAEVLGYTPAYLTTVDMPTLSSLYLPGPQDDKRMASRWLKRLMGELMAAFKDETIDRRIALAAQADLVRQAGAHDAINAGLIFEELAAALDVASLDQELVRMLVDLSSDTGYPIDLGMAQAFVREGVAGKQFILETIRRTEEMQGADKAIILAEQVAAYAPFDDLLDALIDLCKRAGNAAKAADWTARRDAEMSLAKTLKSVGKAAPEIPIN